MWLFNQFYQWLTASTQETQVAWDASAASSPIKVLCVDDDSDFCHYIQRLARSLSIQVDKAYTIAEAKQKIDKITDFQAFIIDGHLPDGSGFELVAWIRQKKLLNVPIAFISRIYQDAASFRLLKESLNVDYVLEKPLRPLEVKGLLIQLCHLDSALSTQESMLPDQLLSSLKETYQKSIIDKVERLERLILTVQRTPSIAHLEALKEEVHKIAGSAGSYGYQMVSELCKNLEGEINQQLKIARTGEIQTDWINSLDEFFTQIKLHFQMQPMKDLTPWLVPTGCLSTIYLVDEDRYFINFFNHNKSPEQLVDILIELNPDKAFQQLNTADFYPQILIVNAYYSSSAITGCELVKAFYQKNDPLSSAVAMLVDSQSIEDQVECLRKGFNFIATKPVSMQSLLPLFNQLPVGIVGNSYQVLVIDDDQDICQYMVQILSQSTIEVQTLSDPEQISEHLKTFTPDLILLDMNLTNHEGRSALDLIREDYHYPHQILGMITVTSSKNQIQKCYDSHVDDLIFKPFEGRMIQNKVTHLLRKQTYAQTLSLSEPFALIDQNVLLDRYLKHLTESPPKPLSIISLALVSIRTEEEQKVLKQVVQEFDYLFRRYELIAYLGNHTFSLVFQGFDIVRMQSILNDFLHHLYENLQRKFPFEKHLKIACGLAVQTTTSETFHKLKEEATQALKEASVSREGLSLETVVSSDFPQLTQQVLVIHDENETIDWIEQLCQKHAYSFLSQTKIDDELKNILQKETLVTIPLFILTGELADTRAVFLLKLLNMHNHLQIPVLYLTKLPSKLHLTQLLKELNYFEKPFHLIIVIEKIPTD